MTEHTYLVTGAAGFVGANLCRRLVASGAKVHAFVRSSTALWRIADVAEQIEIHLVDLRDAHSVDQCIAEIRPTVIYHLATHGAYPFQNDGDEILLTNVFGLWNLLQSCSKHGFELFVNTGSSSEYGRKDFAMRETDVLEPDSYYAVAKAAQSLLSRYCSRTSSLPIVTLRLFSVYGPYEESTRLIPKLLYAALDRETIDLVSPTIARDFVYIDDVMDAYLDIESLRSLSGEILNVGTGVQSQLHQVVEILDRLCGYKVSVNWKGMAPRPWDSETWVADISKAKRLTRFEAKTSLSTGIQKSLEWFSANSRLYKKL